MNSADSRPSPSRRRRVIAYLVVLAVGAAGIAVLVSSLIAGDGSGGADAGGASDVLRISCSGATTTIENTEVEVHPDGVRLGIEADFDEPFVTFFAEEGWRAAQGFGPEFDGSDMFSMEIPPGDVIVECGRREVGAPSGNAVSVHLLDPHGLWQEENPVCGADFIEWNPDQPPFYYTHDNPFPEAIFRTLPGLRPDDEVSFGGYPEGSTGRSPVIVRDGEVIGLLDLSTYDQRTFLLNGIFCASSGVGQAGAKVTGTTSTPFRLPTYPRCDPYLEPCDSVFVSASRYEELTGDLPDLVPPEPWAACEQETRVGCKPEPRDMIVRVVTTPVEAARFVDEYGCGATEDAACTRAASST